MDAILSLGPPPDGDQDRGHVIYSVYWTIFGVGTLVTCLRFWARIKIRALGWDDWLMLCAMVQLLGLAIGGQFLAMDGGCRHIYYLLANDGPQQVILVTKVFYICQPLAIMCIATGRASVAALVLRIMGPSYWRRRFLWFTIVSTLLISALNSILLFTACIPSEGLWNFLITANCWDPVIMTDVTIFSSSWNVFIDFCLALIPITLFWNLNMSIQKRVALCVLMSAGVLAGICGAVKTSKLPEANDLDVTWATFDLLLWNAVETFLVIICGSLPTLKPLYDICLGRVRERYAKRSRATSYPSKSFSNKKNSYPSYSRSTGDEEYIRLEPRSKPSADPIIIEVAHQIDIETWSNREGDDGGVRDHTRPWDKAGEGRESGLVRREMV
ncbi:hypothetical protein MMC34_003258 [Xylographa carneopallida]|nr:hypothetical protein [Xylographa carneopallida]